MDKQSELENLKELFDKKMKSMEAKHAQRLGNMKIFLESKFVSVDELNEVKEDIRRLKEKTLKDK